uniref:Uncharacterized protein n=1 Tax=viral metagenome TaxID=1070528 RepID=A0A6C0JMR8_9ZZZZ
MRKGVKTYKNSPVDEINLYANRVKGGKNKKTKKNRNKRKQSKNKT